MLIILPPQWHSADIADRISGSFLSPMQKATLQSLFFVKTKADSTAIPKKQPETRIAQTRIGGILAAVPAEVPKGQPFISRLFIKTRISILAVKTLFGLATFPPAFRILSAAQLFEARVQTKLARKNIIAITTIKRREFGLSGRPSFKIVVAIPRTLPVAPLIVVERSIPILSITTSEIYIPVLIITPPANMVKRVLSLPSIADKIPSGKRVPLMIKVTPQTSRNEKA